MKKLTNIDEIMEMVNSKYAKMIVELHERYYNESDYEDLKSYQEYLQNKMNEDFEVEITIKSTKSNKTLYINIYLEKEIIEVISRRNKETFTTKIQLVELDVKKEIKKEINLTNEIIEKANKKLETLAGTEYNEDQIKKMQKIAIIEVTEEEEETKEKILEKLEESIKVSTFNTIDNIETNELTEDDSNELFINIINNEIEVDDLNNVLKYQISKEQKDEILELILEKLPDKLYYKVIDGKKVLSTLWLSEDNKIKLAAIN
jgi:hypothetical protein